QNAGGAGNAGAGRDEGHPLVMFLLSPMLMRGNGEAQQLKIARDARDVVLQMKVPAAEQRSFQAVLRTVEGVQVWSKASINARPQAKGGPLVSVSIPAAKLVAADYILTLSAIRDVKEAEGINRYFFRVVRE